MSWPPKGVKVRGIRKPSSKNPLAVRVAAEGMKDANFVPVGPPGTSTITAICYSDAARTTRTGTALHVCLAGDFPAQFTTDSAVEFVVDVPEAGPAFAAAAVIDVSVSFVATNGTAFLMLSAAGAAPPFEAVGAAAAGG